jgi:glycosyltransferase involved in cell wall biosynthesis
MESPTFKTKSGRVVTVTGDPQLLTMDRIQLFSEHFDSDPRIFTISIMATDNPNLNETLLRATAPAGCLIAQIESDIASDPKSASERGLWHDWWLTTSADAKKAPAITELSAIDLQEREDPSSSHHAAFTNTPIDPNNLTVTIDVTWLGPHETGAQVMTTAGTAALAEQPNIKSIRLVGLSELPTYAKHLTDHAKITLGGEGQTDIIWYPNQIDQRVDVSKSRELGKRVITTYLDLIAYDIPRYHASPEAWAAYRAMQRKIALSVDGITTISKDVAKRLYQETPRLDPKRIQAIPLGLDHITTDTKSEKPKDFNPTKPFILVLGNDFNHKNRDFAIKVWQELLNQGRSIDLVLAGLHVKSSSSKAAEQELSSKHVNLRGRITTLGHVTSEERTWLLTNAEAVLYPSSAEGFGFVPYEAAALNSPTTFAAFGPLKEISQLNDLPTTWNSQQFATDLANLIAGEQAHESRLNQLQQRIGVLSWHHFSTQLSAFFTKIAGMPLAPTAALGASSTAESAALAQVLSSKSWKLTAPIRKLMGPSHKS